MSTLPTVKLQLKSTSAGSTQNDLKQAPSPPEK